jgi:hypothetical protein
MKANIKLEEYLNYIQSENFDVIKFNDEYMQYFYGKWNEKDTQIISKALDNVLNKQYCNSKPDSVNISRYNNAKTVDAYIKLNNFKKNSNIKQDFVEFLVKDMLTYLSSLQEIFDLDISNDIESLRAFYLSSDKFESQKQLLEFVNHWKISLMKRLKS